MEKDPLNYTDENNKLQNKSNISENITQETKTKDTHVIIGYECGSLCIQSIEQKKVIHNFQRLPYQIGSIEILQNKKSFFVITMDGNMYQYDNRSKKCIKKTFNYGVDEMFLVRNDKYKFLRKNDGDIGFWSVRGQKLINTIKLEFEEEYTLLGCSQDNK